MYNQSSELNSLRVTASKKGRVNAAEFFSAKVPKLTAAVLAVITLLLIATPVGSRITALLDFNKQIDDNAQQLVSKGRQTFRFDTFGDEAFWGDLLKLHQAIEGAQFGGVGPTPIKLQLS